MGYSVDLNSDLGEGFGAWTLGDDDAMLELVTSANIACGFHAGDPTTLLATCESAAARGVRIGAQVGYRDLAGFGRRFIDVSPKDLTADVIYQIGALDGLARVGGCLLGVPRRRAGARRRAERCADEQRSRPGDRALDEATGGARRCQE